MSNEQLNDLQDEVNELRRDNKTLSQMLIRLFVELDNHNILELGDVMSDDDQSGLVELSKKYPREGHTQDEQDYQYLIEYYGG